MARPPAYGSSSSKQRWQQLPLIAGSSSGSSGMLRHLFRRRSLRKPQVLVRDVRSRRVLGLARA